ncbi:hypothetical protein ACU5EH_22470 [Aliivibrio salmonicida]|uniref:hypothetical protein n=1 Tax=Aliivibrio salmonicida TaxID=40269 RepID=UPI00406CB1CB
MSNVQSTNEKLLRFELYCTTRSEADKSILTLSTASLGLIVTLLTSDKVSSIFELMLFVLGALCFLICIFTVTKIFAENAKYIASPQADGSQLKTLDTITKYAFMGGIILTTIASIIISINTLTNNLKEKTLYEQQRTNQQDSIQKSSLHQGQLGGGKCDLKTSEVASRTTESALVKSKKGLINMPNEKMINYNEDTIKKSWEGANSILEQPSNESSSNDDNSNSNNSESNSDNE